MKEFAAKLALVPIPPPGQLHLVRACGRRRDLRLFGSVQRRVTLPTCLAVVRLAPPGRRVAVPGRQRPPCGGPGPPPAFLLLQAAAAAAGAVVSAAGAARGAVLRRLGPTDAGGRVLPALPAGRSQPLVGLSLVFAEGKNSVHLDARRCKCVRGISLLLWCSATEPPRAFIGCETG